MDDSITNILKNFNNYQTAFSQLKAPSYTNYAKNMGIMNGIEHKSPKEIIEEEEGQDNLKIQNYHCKMCNSNVNADKYFWYYLKHMEDENKSFVLCGLNCLKAYYDKNPNEIMQYEIIEYTRCTAYYKCKKLGNLRGKCQRHENLTVKNLFSINLINFCDPAQAGVILSTYKMNEILNNFSEENQRQAKESNEVLKASASQNRQQFQESVKMLKQSSEESKKQFRITSIMTILTIILTVVNIFIAILTYKNNDVVNELKTLNTKITNIDKNLSVSQSSK